MVADIGFAGRTEELEQLVELLAHAREGRGRTLLLGGEAGIGKTALLQRFGASQLAGVRLLWGTTPVPAGERIPYGPFLDLLPSAARLAPDVLTGLGQLRNDLALVMPDWSSRSPPAQDDPFARHRLHHAVRALLEAIAADQPPLVVVLDDVQWADETSLSLLALLAQQLREAHVLLIAAYRSDVLDTEPALNTLLVELIRSEHIDHLELSGLSVEQLAQAAAAAGVAAGPRVLHTLAQRAGGNPYLFSHLASEANGTAGQLPRDLRALLLRRIEDLPSDARRMARVIAVAGPAATTSVLGLAEPNPEQRLDGLRSLVRAGVLDMPAGAAEAYAFRQPLMQEAVLADLLPDERSAIHRQLARALESDQPTRRDPAGLVQRAIHWAAAADPQHTLGALLEGAEAAQRLYAFELSHSFLEQALAALVQADPEAAELAALRLRAAQAAYLSGKPERAVELVELNLRAGSGEQEQPALELERLAWYRHAAGQDEAAIATLARAAQQADRGQPTESSRVLTSYGRLLMLAGRFAEAEEILSEATRLAHDARSAADESRALAALAAVVARQGRAAEAALRLDEARRIDEQRRPSMAEPRPSRIGYLIESLLDRATAMEHVGQLEAAAAEAQAALGRAESLGGAAWAGQISVAAAERLFLLGRWPEAEQMLADAPAGQSAERLQRAALGARLAIGQGRLSEAASILQQAGRELQPSSASKGWALLQLAAAELGLARNRPDEAREAVEQGLVTLSSADELLTVELVVTGLEANAQRAELARSRRIGGQEQALEEDALVLAARGGLRGTAQAHNGAAGRLAVLRLLGEAELERIKGRPDPDTWRTVAEGFAALGEPLSAARARWQEATALLAARRDRPRAEESLRLAHETALRLGATELIARTAGLARSSRIRLAESATTDSTTARRATGETGADPLEAELGLSQRELEVLLLIAEGRTNRQIAQALFITEKTAGHHVSSILAKLGVSSRIEAAAVAYSHQLVSPGTLPALE